MYFALNALNNKETLNSSDPVDLEVFNWDPWSLHGGPQNTNGLV